MPPINVKTAEKMYDFSVKHNLGSGNGKGWSVKHFNLIANTLKPDEEVYVVFIGLHNYQSMTKHDGNFAYAVTNKRIIMAQKKILGEVVHSVSLENINNIILNKSGIGSLGVGTVQFDTITEAFNVGANVLIAQNIYETVHEALEEIKSASVRSSLASNMATNNEVVTKSPVEQLKEFKELLDMGIITQEEFDKKKAQLLQL